MTIENEQAILAGQIPLHHKDPFVRMLIAQARLESMGIITNDSKFKSNLPIICCRFYTRPPAAGCLVQRLFSPCTQ